jgi:hypothetical protein
VRFVPPDDGQQVTMGLALQQCKTDLVNLKGKLNTPWSFGAFVDTVFGSDNSDRAADGAYLQWSNQVDALGSSQWNATVNGEMALESWFSIARALHDAITSTAKDADNWQWQGVVSQTAAATVEDLKNKLPDAPTVAVGGIVVVIGLIALAVILVKVR